MLDALKFVKGAVGKENKITPALNHFHIERGRITGLNETYAISAPIATDIEATPKGSEFARAIEKCKGETITLYMEDGRLVVKSGRLTVRIDCATEPFPTLQPEGQSFWLAPNFVAECKKLVPFITKDNTRAWARGLLLEGATLTATDNVAIVQAYLGDEFAPPMGCVIPEQTVRELIRIGEAPKYATVSIRTVTFFYDDGRWLCSVVLPNDWPDVSRFFVNIPELQPLTPEFWEAVDTIYAFTNDHDSILFDPDCIRSSADTKAGARVDGEFFAKKGAICAKNLLRLKPIATNAAFGEWPLPMRFNGPNIRGAIAGMTRPDVK